MSASMVAAAISDYKMPTATVAAAVLDYNVPTTTVVAAVLNYKMRTTTVAVVILDYKMRTFLVAIAIVEGSKRAVASARRDLCSDWMHDSLLPRCKCFKSRFRHCSRAMLSQTATAP